MTTGNITFNNDGIHESVNTLILDDPRVEIGDLIHALKEIAPLTAKIQLMGDTRFQLLRVSNDLIVLAPLDWEGCDSNEADINAGTNGAARDGNDCTKQEQQGCPRARNFCPRCCATHN